MRDDIEAAVSELDREARSHMKKLRNYKKALEGLADLIGSQRVIALAPATDPMRSLTDTGFNMADTMGGSFSRFQSNRLLVVTTDSLWQAKMGNALGRGAPVGIELPLEAIRDVRTRVDRVLMKKVRVLMVDYQRGVQIETDVHEVLSDRGLELVAEALKQRVPEVHQEVAESEDQRQVELLKRAGEAVAAANGSLSVADEIAKLAALRDQGDLSPEEFAAAKRKLMA
jgi:hypothetical protein